MKPVPFDRIKHVYKSDDFEELVKDAVRFFNGTPVHPLPPPESFLGTGVYALYYTGSSSPYKRYAELNRLAYNHPIYVGKAVPKGWRKARVSENENGRSRALFLRLKEHAKNISEGAGLSVSDFSCRFIIFESGGSSMIGTIEAALIKLNLPLWNTVVDGFGNHTPGNGRFEQAKSGWDVIHPGRAWAEKCKGIPTDKDKILSNIELHLRDKK